MNRIFFLFLFFFTRLTSDAQQSGTVVINQLADSLKRVDSLSNQDSSSLARTDTIKVITRFLADSTRPIQTVAPFQLLPNKWHALAKHPQFFFKSQSTETLVSSLKQVNGKELLFYLIVFLLIVFAIIRNNFPRYFNDLFRLFFKRTLNQKQVRDQLMQTPLPSLLMNGFFVISGGLYLAFMLQHFKIDKSGSFWLMFFYSCLGLSLAYFIKFAGLKICGWLFNLEEAADSYVFVIFVVNKMLGILLIPFLLVLAFSIGEFYSFGLTFSWCFIAIVLIYRIRMTFSIVRNEVKINPFHFLLYVAALEIAPLLLVYKGLLIFFNQTT